jgi:hypothetical protein
MASNDAREHERKEGLRERERAAAERLARLADERRREEEARRPTPHTPPFPVPHFGYVTASVT